MSTEPGAASAEPDLSTLVARAKEGDRAALEQLVVAIQGRVYNLALRMLWHPADAEDATQEILIRVVTHLGAFRGESAVMTWVYRIAVNYLLTTRKRRMERQNLTFAAFAEDLDRGLGDEPAPSSDPATAVEAALLAEEVKLGCTLGMLLCLDRDHRVAYILGEVFALSGDEAAQVLEISPATYRKRLSRARGRLRDFLRAKCGLVNPANPCRCRRRIDYAIATGRVEPARLLFATHPPAGDLAAAARQATGEMESLYDAAELMRSHPSYPAPASASGAIRSLLASDARLLAVPEIGR